MNELTNYNESVFENIKHIDENGIEYWEARELQKVLEYKEWRKFEGVINKAKQACDTSKFNVSEHFVGADKTIKMPKGAKKIICDYKLSRYACYLIVQNADSRKKVIALGQTYFAIQTRKQEISELEYEKLTEDEKRFYQRSKVRKENYALNQTAKKAGVKNFDKFHNAGYKGLYNGETADDISKRKGLRYREDILDNMGSDELAANLFRISLTNQKINNEKIKGETPACDAHYEVGDAIRTTIKQVGGTLPEEMPVPDKSLKELVKKEENKKFIDTIK
ncbi:MAG TPA: DNA damage-inducible protein D [Candidatus Aphodocola excrementigallinarum]|uniref:DNA damage-inducible protein D n=1 Tax=Candidatus Aphodocola excrementigallinarum TaxID=2840670 RepID=A0A9D1LGN3_9FIRM|nr:DNA damage-inducible protein D [Candidatus Aphodocola excrementigallinarum]